MKTIRVFIEKGKDGKFSAYMPDDNHLDWGIHGDGASVKDAIADLNSEYENMKTFFKEEGKPFEEVDFAFSFDVPSFLTYCSDLFSLKALSRLSGISASQLSQYISGYRNPSPKTIEKIKEALHTIGKELSELSLD